MRSNELNLCVCKHCGEEFTSKKTRKYCSFDCYVRSPDFLAMAAANSKKASKKTEIVCLKCGETKKVPPSRANRKFCSQACYRKYFAERFDRWYANPQTVPLPQAYDEFLSQTELDCPLEGCDWRGKFLGLHVNMVHGIPASEFKRLGGFNASTGLVSIDTHEKMASYRQGTSLHLPKTTQTRIKKKEPKSTRTMSLEAREHCSKAQAERWLHRPMQTVICVDCKIKVHTKVPERTLYCKKCCNRRADKARRERNKLKKHRYLKDSRSPKQQ